MTHMGVFVGFFQLTRKSLMTYDPIGIIFPRDFVSDLDISKENSPPYNSRGNYLGVLDL